MFFRAYIKKELHKPLFNPLYANRDNLPYICFWCIRFTLLKSKRVKTNNLLTVEQIK